MTKVDFVKELRRTLRYEPQAATWNMIKVLWDTDSRLGIETTPQRVIDLFPDLVKPYKPKNEENRK